MCNFFTITQVADQQGQMLSYQPVYNGNFAPHASNNGGRFTDQVIVKTNIL